MYPTTIQMNCVLLVKTRMFPDDMDNTKNKNVRNKRMKIMIASNIAITQFPP